MTTYWTYRRTTDGHLFVEQEDGVGRVLEVYSTKELADNKCPAGCAVIAMTFSELNLVHVRRPLQAVYLDGEPKPWPDFEKDCNGNEP